MLVFGGGSPVVTWKETETTQLKSLQMPIFYGKNCMVLQQETYELEKIGGRENWST